jgi:glycosyltransferase involved in cell wall biosynthesis
LYMVSPGGELMGEVPGDVPVHVFGVGKSRGGATPSPALSMLQLFFGREKSHGDAPGPGLVPARKFFLPGHAHQARVQDLARVLEKQQIDVVYDRTYHMTLISAGATRRRPTPRVSVVVTDPQRDFETNVERFRFIKRHLLRRAYQTADRVVAVSEGVRRAAVAHYGLADEKTLTIYNGFDVARIDRLMAEPLPEGEGRRPDRFEIVAAGRLHLQKGFLVLLEAIRRLVKERGLSQIHLRILGTGGQEGALKAYMAEHSLAAHVTLAGFRANPLPYFRQADLFCLSSLYEGMPNALVEAMLCRVPVLATDCPSGPGEVLEGGKWGRLVQPGDAVALAEAIEDAIRRPEEWQKLVAGARERIERDFSPVAAMGKLEELLVEVASR